MHTEDFAQVFGLYPERKYERASYRNLAEVLLAESGDTCVIEFVRRLVFNALIGNADMHLKNWSLIYPDRRRPQLAPCYDVVSTIAYLDDTDMALTLGRSKRIGELRPGGARCRRAHHRADRATAGDDSARSRDAALAPGPLRSIGRQLMTRRHENCSSASSVRYRADRRPVRGSCTSVNPPANPPTNPQDRPCPIT